MSEAATRDREKERGRGGPGWKGRKTRRENDLMRWNATIRQTMSHRPGRLLRPWLPIICCNSSTAAPGNLGLLLHLAMGHECPGDSPFACFIPVEVVNHLGRDRDRLHCVSSLGYELRHVAELPRIQEQQHASIPSRFQLRIHLPVSCYCHHLQLRLFCHVGVR